MTLYQKKEQQIRAGTHASDNVVLVAPPALVPRHLYGPRWNPPRQWHPRRHARRGCCL